MAFKNKCKEIQPTVSKNNKDLRKFNFGKAYYARNFKVRGKLSEVILVIYGDIKFKLHYIL